MARKYKFLTLSDRQQIAALYLNGERPADIAEQLGVHTATIYHELERGFTGSLDRNQRAEYSPEKAQREFQASMKNRGRKAAAQ